MRVPNIDHDAGAQTGTPRPEAVRVNTRAAAPSISLTRLAWFDANGDGRIDTRAAGAGGDATLLVPTHEVDLPTYGRAASTPLDGRVSHSKDAGKEPVGTAAPPTLNLAQTQRAVDTYQRYGQAPDVVPASPATPTAVADAVSAASLAPTLARA